MTQLPRQFLGDMERKIYALYMLRELGPIPNLQLIAFAMEHQVMNYFDLQTALHSLVEQGQATRHPIPGDEVYAITPEGLEAITLFAGRAGQSALLVIQEKAPAFRQKMKQERELFARIHHQGQQEYHAQMGIQEGDMALLRLDLSLPTAALADKMAKAWPARAREIYDYLLSVLSQEGE